MRVKQFKLPAEIKNLPHRERIMAKRELYGLNRKTQRPFGLIELFDTDKRRKYRLPHQSIRECARRSTRRDGPVLREGVGNV